MNQSINQSIHPSEQHGDGQHRLSATLDKALNSQSQLTYPEPTPGRSSRVTYRGWIRHLP